MTSRTLLAITVAALTLLPWPVLAAQDDDDRVELRAEEVVLELTLTDRNGKPVLDLRPEEVRVFEGGEPETLTSFNLMRSSAPTSDRASGGADGARAGGSERTYNLVFLVVDWTSGERMNRALIAKAATRFVEKKMARNDLVAVMVAVDRLLIVQNFTNDKGSLTDAIRTATTGKRSRSRPNGQGRVEDLAVVRQLDTCARRIDCAFADLASRFIGGTLIADLSTLTEAYRDAPGLKSVILFSEGLRLDEVTKPRFEALIRQAREREFRFYTVDVEGLRGEPRFNGVDLGADVPAGRLPGRSRADRPLNSRASAGGGYSGLGRAEYVLGGNRKFPLHRLARETGGVALFGNNDLGRGFEALASERGSYYLITYAPRASVAGPRSVTVAVARKGVQVRARGAIRRGRD